MELKLLNGMDRSTLKKNKTSRYEIRINEIEALKSAIEYEKNRSGCVGISQASWRKPYSIPGIDLFFKKDEETLKQHVKQLNKKR